MKNYLFIIKIYYYILLYSKNMIEEKKMQKFKSK